MNKSLFTKRSVLYIFVVFLLLVTNACADRGNRPVNSENISQKPGTPISISYRVQDTIVLGEKSSISITIHVSADMDDLTLRLRPSAGLVITSDEKGMHLGSVKGNSKGRKTITFSVQKEGNYHINLIVTGQVNGKIVARTTTIPIKTVNAPEKIKKSRGTVTTDSRGERMIILPAEESGN